MSKVEDAARAIYEGRNGHGCKPWAHLPKVHREPYLSDACAAIKAMRPATLNMLTAFVDADTSLKDAEVRWAAAIGAALSEVKG